MYSKMYSFLVDKSEHKKAKGSINQIQSKDHRIGTYEINKIPLSCIDDKIYMQGNGYDGLALGYQI